MPRSLLSTLAFSLSLPLVLAACTDERADRYDAGGITTGALDSETGLTGDEEQGDTEMPDEGFNPEGGEHPPCNMVDILFVIDDSESMSDNQQQLIAGVPQFVDSIQERVDLPSGFHVGVTTTNAYAFNESGCRDEGALVTRTGGQSSSNEICGPFAEGNYMTPADDFAEAFGCTALVGTEGSAEERPLDVARAALSAEMAEEGGCNEGFLRPNALLVLVLITDEEDDTKHAQGPFEANQVGSEGDPQDWFEDLVATRGGLEQNLVVLSLVGQTEGDCNAEPSPRLIEFTEKFTNGYVGDVCANDYGAFFDEAVTVVETACHDFVPEG